MKICFSIYDTDYSTFINMLFILAKKHIYRVQETKVYFPDFERPDFFYFILFYFLIEKIEKHIEIKKDKQSSHIKKWDPLMRNM